MQREIIDKANKIISLIKQNEDAVEELQKYSEQGKILYTDDDRYMNHLAGFPKSIHFEDWEIRLMIHNKKQRIAALEKQLDQL